MYTKLKMIKKQILQKEKYTAGIPIGAICNNAASSSGIAETIIIVRIWQTAGSTWKNGWKAGKSFQHTPRNLVQVRSVSYMANPWKN